MPSVLSQLCKNPVMSFEVLLSGYCKCAMEGSSEELQEATSVALFILIFEASPVSSRSDPRATSGRNNILGRVPYLKLETLSQLHHQ